MSLTSFFSIVCFEIDVLVCIFISCSVFKDHLHLSSAHLYYQILLTSSNVFLIFFMFFTVYAYIGAFKRKLARTSLLLANQFFNFIFKNMMK